MSDAPFVCERCGAPLDLPTDAAVLDVACSFCKTRTPTPSARLDALRRGRPLAPAQPSRGRLAIPFAVFGLGAVVVTVWLLSKGASDPGAPAAPSATAKPTSTATATASAPPGKPSLGTLVAKFGGKGTNPGLFDDARAIAIDPDGNLFIADYTSGRLQELDENGKFLRVFTIPDRDGHKYVFGVACDYAGAVYVSRTEDVLEFSVKDGTLLATIKEKKRTDGKHARPDEMCAKQIAVDAANELFVLSDCTPQGLSVDIESPYALVKLDAKGAQTGHYKGVGGAVASIAVDGIGNVFVGNELDDAVYAYDAKGTFTNKWGQRGKEAGDFDGGLQAIALDGRGHVYAMDTGGVGVFDTNGKPRGRFGQWGRAMAVAPKGDVYILENDGIVERYRVTPPE